MIRVQEEYIEGLLEVLSNYASLNFETKMEQEEPNSLLSAVSFGVNMLGEELKASTVNKTFMDAIFNSMNEMLIVLNKDGIIEKVNPCVTQTLDFPMYELLGTDMGLLFVNRAFKANVTRMVFKKEVISGMLSKFRTKDGRVIPVSFSSAVIKNEAGEKAGAVCLIRDITVQSENEKSLARYREVIKNSYEAIFIVNPQSGEIWDVNSTACDHTGYERTEIIGKNINEYEPVFRQKYEDPNDWKRFIGFLKKSRQLDIRESEYVRKNGEFYPVEIITSYIDVDDDSVCVVSVKDLTHNKTRERELSEKNDILERFHKVTVNRELDMISLKMEVNDLMEQLGQVPKYNIPNLNEDMHEADQ